MVGSRKPGRSRPDDEDVAVGVHLVVAIRVEAAGEQVEQEQPGEQAEHGGGGEAGADLLAIESTGGKEVSDPALMNADLRRIAFALGVLALRQISRAGEEMLGHRVAIAGERRLVAQGHR